MKSRVNTVCLMLAASMALLWAPAWSMESHETAEQVEDKLCRAVDSGDVTEALRLARSLYDLDEKNGCDCNRLARRLSDLSKLIMVSGDYAGAREPLDKAIRLLDKDPSAADQKVLVNTLIQLGELVSYQGDHTSAVPLLHRAIALCDKLADPQAKKLKGTALVRLAQTLDNSAKSDQSYALYEQALSFLEHEPDADKEDLIDCLNSLATQLQAKKKYKEAAAYLERALPLSEGIQGRESDTAVILNNLAMVERDQKNYAGALPKLKKALQIMCDTVGPDHLGTAKIHQSLADVYYLKGDLPSARAEVLLAAQIINKQILNVLPALSLAEQESFLATSIPLQLSLSLSTCRNGKELQESYGIIMNWKGLLIDSLRSQKSVMKMKKNAESEKLAEKLDQLRTEIAGWYGQAGTVPYAQWKKTNESLTQEKEEIERHLSLSIRKSGNIEPVKLDCQKLAGCLRADESLVDIFEYAPFGRVNDKHYAAVILSSSAQPQLVELGAVRDISLVVARWRTEVLASKVAEDSWADLQNALWAPVQKLLHAGVKKVFLCPDGELARIPWHLLPESSGKEPGSAGIKPTLRSDAVSSSLQNSTAPGILRQAPGAAVLLTEIDSARELYALRKSPALAADGSLLVVGGIDFNSNPYGRDTQPALVKLPLLPGTLTEINRIKNIAARDRIDVNELTGANATKQAILDCLPASEYVHLATHGFFFDENYVQAVQQLAAEQDKNKHVLPVDSALKTRSVTVLPSTARRTKLSQQRNPLVESGIAVAGANLRDPGTRENLGYVTAEELVGMDLEKCKMMTLSACETGRGEEITGQGVMGLRAAIMSAGVRSILMSVWKVPDDATVRLMEEFYTNLWTKKMAKAEALRQAQLSLKNDAKKPQFRNPVSWSAWVLVGEGW